MSQLPRDDNSVPIQMGGSLSEEGNNTSTTPLASEATFTGQWELNPFPDVMVSLITDNTGTLYFDFSNDGVNADSTFPVQGFAVASGVHEFHTAVKGPRYFRVRLVNDTGAQTYLRLYTYFGAFRQGNLPLNQSVGLDADAQLVRSTVPQDEIGISRRSGVTSWNKFGYNTDVDAAAAEVVAAFGGTFTPMTTADTFDITYNNATDGSGGGATGATQLTFFYIDADGLPAVAAHTLGSDGSDTTAFTGLGINRVAVSASGTADGNVNDITVTATTAGTNQASVPAGGSTTQQAIFFVGSNHTALIRFMRVTVDRSSGGGSPRVQVKGFAYNRGVDTKYEVFRDTINTSIRQGFELEDPIGFKLNATDVFWLEASTSANNTEIDVRFSLNEYQIT